MDNTSNTVTLATSGGNTLTLTDSGTELNTQNMALTVQATSSTTIAQSSNSITSTGSLLSEYGSNTSITNGQAMTANTTSDIAGSNFTLPTAGVWEVTYFLTIDSTATPQLCVAFMTTDLNVLVPQSVLTFSNIDTGVPTFTLSQKVYITTTGSANYKLRAALGPTAAAITIRNNNNITAADSNGSSTIYWKKISGFIPATATTDYIYAVPSANQTGAGTNTDIVFNTTLSGNISHPTSTTFVLTAGKTYEITGAVRTTAWGVGAFVRCAWVDSANTELYANKGQSTNLSVIYPTTNDSIQPIATLVYTPVSNISIKLRIISVFTTVPSANTGSIDAANTFVYIKEIGTTALVVPTWQTYVPTFTAASGSKPASPSIDSATYLINGKTISLTYTFRRGATAGTSSGANVGRFSLPAGITFDTTALTVDGTLTANNGPYGSVFGNGYLATNITAGGNSNERLIVYAFDSTNFGIYTDAGSGTMGRFGPSQDFFSLGASGTGFSVTFSAPIN